MAYPALKKRIASLKSPIFLDDRKEYPYLSQLKKDLPRVEFYLTQPDLVIYADVFPETLISGKTSEKLISGKTSEKLVSGKTFEISFSKYRFIQFVDQEGFSYMKRVNRWTPVLRITESPMFEGLGFRFLQPTEDKEDIIVEGKKYFFPKYPEPISREPFRTSLPAQDRPGSSLRSGAEPSSPRSGALLSSLRSGAEPSSLRQIVINELANFHALALTNLILDYVEEREILIHQWTLLEIPEHRALESEYNLILASLRSGALPSSPRSDVSQGEIYVASEMKKTKKFLAQVRVLSLKGELLRDWKVKDRYIRGMALSPDGNTVYTLDSDSDNVSVISPKGKFLKDWPILPDESKDNSVTEVKIRVGPNGDIYIIFNIEGQYDDELPYIQVYTPEGKLIRTITFPERGDLQDMAFFKGEIFISDAKNSCIHVLSSSNDLIGKIRMPEEPLGEASLDPGRLVISSEGEIYVSGQKKDDQVYVFDIDGVFRRRLHYPFRHIRAMAISAQDEIYVADESIPEQYQVLIFQKGY
jgi:WD40 repeat protein